jgi:hypothetical protein
MNFLHGDSCHVKLSVSMETDVIRRSDLTAHGSKLSTPRNRRSFMWLACNKPGGGAVETCTLILFLMYNVDKSAGGLRKFHINDKIYSLHS